MSDPSSTAASLRSVRWAWALFGLEAILFLVGLSLTLVPHNPTPSSWGLGGAVASIGFAVMIVSFPAVGLVLVTRRPANVIGWILLGIGFVWALDSLMGGYSGYGLSKLPYMPGATLALAIDQPLWVPAIGLIGTFLILLFPDGHLPSPRWRWFARLTVVVMVLGVIAIVFKPGSLADAGYPLVHNPLGIAALRSVLDVLTLVLVFVPIAMVGSAVSLVQRYRRSSGVERSQLKWLASAAGAVAVVFLVALLLSFAIPSNRVPTWLAALQDVALLSLVLIPVAIGFAVLKYRLYEIDVVINRALVFTSLAAFITAIYVAIVAGVGALVGSGGNTVLSAIAAALIALAFQPARRRAQRFADRLVYGNRATPYEVLSHFSDRLSGTYAQEDLLPRMATILADGTGAVRTEVWLRVGDHLRVGATWPADEVQSADSDELVITSDELPPFPDADLAMPVRHQGDLLGALVVRKRPGEALSVTEQKLVTDLASQAGLVLRNARLSTELLQRLDELKASRQRLVAAQDEERRKLERNIHDGAQQQLVALAVKLRLAHQLVDRDAEKAKGMLEDLQREAGAALDDLRDLARGVYPPLLADKGLTAAIEAQASRAQVPVRVEPDGVGRYGPDVEATVYFCVLEALNNVMKYAEASSVLVRLGSTGPHRLEFQVKDDGRGFDVADAGYGTGLQGMQDRLASLDGDLEVRSTPGSGTTITGRLPASPG